MAVHTVLPFSSHGTSEVTKSVVSCERRSARPAAVALLAAEDWKEKEKKAGMMVYT